MEIKITGKKENPMLNRIEYEADLIYNGKTPNYAEVAKELAATVKSDEKSIAVKHIYPKFGIQTARVVFYAYNSEGDLKKIEPKQKEKKAKTPKVEAKPEEKK